MSNRREMDGKITLYAMVHCKCDQEAPTKSSGGKEEKFLRACGIL